LAMGGVCCRDSKQSGTEEWNPNQAKEAVLQGLENVDEYNTGPSSKIAAQSTSSWQRQSSLESSKVGDDAKLDRSVTSVSFKEDDVLHLFRKFDANRDDSVSPEELLAVLQQLSDPADSRGERLEELLQRIDTNGDGLIQLEEFMAWCSASGDVWKKLRWTCFNAVRAERARLSTNKHFPARNQNRISHFPWLEDILKVIVDGKNKDVSVIKETGELCTPLLLVAGACPNSICGMQAVMFTQVKTGIEFWWTKPQADLPNKLDPNTLNLHKEGPHRNATSKSRALYQPLADKFKGSKEDPFEFGVDDAGRAFIDEKTADGCRRMLLYLVWQENWSSFFAYNKFIEGKLFYQRGQPWDQPVKASHKVNAPFFARQYRLEGKGLKIAGIETEETVLSLLPPDVCQEMFKFDSDA